MTEQERSNRLYIATALAALAEVLICVLGNRHAANGWVLFGAVLFGAAITVYILRLQRIEREKRELDEMLKQEREKNSALCRTLDNEREEYRQRLDKARAESQRAICANQRACGERIEEFQKKISHRFRLPISVAAGYAELLRDGAAEDPDEAREYLDKIAGRLHYMNQLLMRSLSDEQEANVASGVSLYKVEFDLVAFIRDNLNDLGIAAQDKQVQLQFVTIEPYLLVCADHVLLRHVLDILIENALKYMGRPGLVTFALRRDGETVQLCYRDDGMGMDAMQAKHVFENGFRGGNAAKKTGSGKGLHLVNVIVQAHGGQVSADSEPGGGIQIHISLPIARQESVSPND